MNGSTFPVCACGLLKLDASTAMLDTELVVLTRAMPSRKRKRGDMVIAMMAADSSSSMKEKVLNRLQATSIPLLLSPSLLTL